MREKNEMYGGYIRDFTENYMEKLFYFCLKRTGNQTDAEDLTQDIAYQVITALNKGIEPKSFPGWVWQIAHNRYSVWAREKHIRTESVTGADIEDYEIIDTDGDVLDEMIFAEQKALLRRELAFIKSDYRNIIVAYYIEDKSVRKIASELSLPENTVKSKLLRARKLLKEGMEMAREFGKMSYNPEKVDFFMNGSTGKNGEPWSIINRSLCKNILLAAYRTPSTAEELSMEVGVALPYMEEELSALVDATLMKKNGNKYETSFFILSSEAQEKIYTKLRSITPELTKIMEQTADSLIAYHDEHLPGWNGGYQPPEDMKWAVLLSETDQILINAQKSPRKTSENYPGKSHSEFTVRPNGGAWDLLGMENYDGDKPSPVGLHGCMHDTCDEDLPNINFLQYKFRYGRINERTPDFLSYKEGETMVAVANGKSSEADESVLKRLENYGYIRKTDDGYEPAIMVIHKKDEDKLYSEEYASLKSQAEDIARQYYIFCMDTIKKEIPDFLKDDEFQIAHACFSIMFSIRFAVLDEAVKQNYLKYDENNDKQMLGALLII